MLRINFFPTWLPEDDLSFVVRDKAPGEALRPWERAWEALPAPDGGGLAAEGGSGRQIWSNARKAVVIGPLPPNIDLAGYQPELRRARDAPPSVVRALISAGLQQSLRAKGQEIEPDPVGFRCFDPLTMLEGQVGDIVGLRKGMRFRVDHLVVRGRRVFGFFVSPATRLQFRVRLIDDQQLAMAVIGERIAVRDQAILKSGELRSVDFPNLQARVVVGSEEKLVALSDVEAKATPAAISRYFRSRQIEHLAREIRLAPQIASYRLLQSGQRNRRWLAQQYEYVGSWLLTKSESGRLRFRWPESSTELYVSAEALKITAGAA